MNMKNMFQQFMGGEKPSVEIWLKAPGGYVPTSDQGKVRDIGEDFVQIERDGGDLYSYRLDAIAGWHQIQTR